MNIAMIVHNRPRLTRQAIESLYATAHGFRLAVVDDCSDIGTGKMLQELQERFRFNLARTSENIGVGAARNLSIGKNPPMNSLLYITDNDAYFLPGWQSTLIENFSKAEDRGFKVLGAYNHPFHKPIGWEKDGVGEVFFGATRKLWSCYALGSFSWLMRWETWDKYGPLTVTPVGRIGSSEDHEFCQKIRNDGYRVGCIVPHAVLNCGRTNALGDVSPGEDWLLKQPFPEGVIVE